MELENIKYIAKAITVVGLAAVSVWEGKSSKWERGDGWGILAFLVLVFA